MSIIQIEDLTFTFPKTSDPVIADFNMAMNKGEIVGVIGTSGSGKSTLLRIIAGLEIPEKGTIRISGDTIVSSNQFVQPEARGIGMVFQDYALFPHLTVKGNIMFALHKFSKKERLTRLKDMLELVQMSGYEDRYPHELSGGQQQRVALARALAPKPVVLLMDEPFSNLDTDLKTMIRYEMRDILKKAEMTCLIVTHDQMDVECICDRSIAISPVQRAKVHSSY